MYSRDIDPGDCRLLGYDCMQYGRN